MNKTTFAALALAAALAGCSDADMASANLSKAADNFEIARRVVFYNGFTNDYLLSLEGLCSIGTSTSSKGITVTCKTGPGAFKKHMLGLSDNVTYFVEQLEPAAANTYHYRVIFKPSAIVPSVEVK